MFKRSKCLQLLLFRYQLIRIKCHLKLGSLNIFMSHIMDFYSWFSQWFAYIQHVLFFSLLIITNAKIQHLTYELYTTSMVSKAKLLSPNVQQNVHNTELNFEIQVIVGKTRSTYSSIPLLRRSKLSIYQVIFTLLQSPCQILMWVIFCTKYLSTYAHI